MARLKVPWSQGTGLVSTGSALVTRNKVSYLYRTPSGPHSCVARMGVAAPIECLCAPICRILFIASTRCLRAWSIMSWTTGASSLTRRGCT